MYSNILDHVKTTNDIHLLADELQTLEKRMYKVSDKEIYDKLKKTVRSWVADMIVEGTVTRDSKKAFLTDLRKEIETLPEIRLTLAFEPSRNMIEKVSDWVRENVDSRVILDLSVDSSLLAGLTIDYKGEYRDYSLSESIDKIFERRNEELSKLLIN